MACNILLAYPDFNEEFTIHADARNFQLGTVISHKGKLVSLYYRKITDYYKRYTVIEMELLSIVETLK